MSLKSVSKNTVIYSLGTVALRLTTFLLIPLYTHYLTKSEFGLLQTLLFTIQIIITINDIGMRSALMRFFPEYLTKGRISELLGSSFSINIFAGLFFILGSSLLPDSLISNLFEIDTIPNLLLLTVCVGVSQTLSLNILSYFRALDKGMIYMTISLITALVLVLNTYIFLVELELGIIGIMWAQTITFFCMWFIVLLWIVFKHKPRIDLDTIYTLLKFGFPLIFAMSGDIIISTTGNYFLGYFHNLEEVAIFSLAYKIAAISIMILIGPFQMAYEPYIFRHKNNPNLNKLISKITTYVVFAYLILSVGILFIFKDLISLIGKSEYDSAYIILFLLLPGIGSMIFNYIGQSLLHFNNKTKTTGFLILLSTLLTLFLSYFVIRELGILGLVISLNFYLFLSSSLLMYFGNRELGIKFETKRISIITIIGAFLFLSIYYLSFMTHIVYYTVTPLIILLIAILIYNSNLFLIEEKEMLHKLFRNIKSKLA